MRDRARPESHVDEGIELEQALSLRLGVATADSDHLLGIAPLECFCLREMGGEALVGLFPDRAGVEDDHVCLVLRSRLSQSELFEHALDPLRIMGVHLAAERGDVVAAHGPRIVALGAYGL